MNAFLTRYSIASWATWLKLAVSLTIVALLSIFATVINVQQLTSDVNEENLREYLLDEGVERETAIVNNVADAQVALTNFSANSINTQLLISAIAGFSTEEDIQSLISALDISLMSTGNFKQVLLLNGDAQIITSNTDALSIFEAGFQISPENILFPVIQGARASETSSYFDVRIVNEIPFGYLVVRFGAGDNIIGFMLVELDVATLVQSALVDEVRYQNTYSYMATLDGNILAPEGLEEEARASMEQNNVIGLALQGNSGIADYEVNGEERLGYYQSFLNRFVLVTEVSVIVPANATDILSAALPLLVGVFAVIIGLIYLGNRFISRPIKHLEAHIYNMQNNDFASPIEETQRTDEIGGLARAFLTTREHTRQAFDELRERITSGARDLDATREVSRFASTQRDTQALMDNVVNLIIDKFPNIYHAQIFLLDADGSNAVLRASTGEAGRILLERGHRLGVGSVSIIGQVTDEVRVVAARDIESSDVHHKNEFLQETQSELAIPLVVGEIIIGALDVQSKERNTFDQEQISILQTMADQIAIAIENARLYEESVQRLEELALTNQQATARAWSSYMQARSNTILYSEAGRATPHDYSSLREQAVAEERPIIGEQTPHDTIPFAVPIILRRQTLGAVQWELPVQDFHEEKVALAQELVNRLALSLDNARLFQESQRAVNRERIVNEITSRLTEQTNIEEILQTAVREVGQALRVPHVSINLETQNQQNGSNGAGQIIEGDL